MKTHVARGWVITAAPAKIINNYMESPLSSNDRLNKFLAGTADLAKNGNTATTQLMYII